MLVTDIVKIRTIFSKILKSYEFLGLIYQFKQYHLWIHFVPI